MKRKSVQRSRHGKRSKLDFYVDEDGVLDFENLCCVDVVYVYHDTTFVCMVIKISGRGFLVALVCPYEKIYYLTCFLVIVLCNKNPLSILTQVFVSYFVLLQKKVEPFHDDQHIT